MNLIVYEMIIHRWWPKKCRDSRRTPPLSPPSDWHWSRPARCGSTHSRTRSSLLRRCSVGRSSHPSMRFIPAPNCPPPHNKADSSPRPHPAGRHAALPTRPWRSPVSSTPPTPWRWNQAARWCRTLSSRRLPTHWPATPPPHSTFHCPHWSAWCPDMPGPSILLPRTPPPDAKWVLLWRWFLSSPFLLLDTCPWSSWVWVFPSCISGSWWT